MQFRKQRDAFQLLYDYFRKGRRSSLNVVVLTPYVEQFTNIFLGYSAIVKDYSKVFSPGQSIDMDVNHVYRGFLGSNTDVKLIKWKKYEVMDYHYKRPFDNLVLGIDYDAIEKKFPAGDSDSDDDWSDDGIFNHDVAVPDIIFNNLNGNVAVRVFKVFAKINDFPSLLVGETRFIIGLSSLPVESVNDGFPIKFYWDLGEMQLVENDTLIFLPYDCLEKLETIWLNSNNEENIFEFLLLVDFEQGVLRFGLNDQLLLQTICFQSDLADEIRIYFTKTTESLMILEVFNQPKTLSSLVPECLLNMYQEQADDLFSCQWPNEYVEHLVKKFFFQNCSKGSTVTDEHHPLMVSRKSLLEAHRITRKQSQAL